MASTSTATPDIELRWSKDFIKLIHMLLKQQDYLENQIMKECNLKSEDYLKLCNYSKENADEERLYVKQKQMSKITYRFLLLSNAK